MILFTTKKYDQFLAEDVLKYASYNHLHLRKGSLERKEFGDGESYHRILEDIRNQDVAILGATDTDEATMEMYDLACAMVKYGAKTLSLIIPFYGYSTMERAVEEGEVVKAKTRARLLSSIPRAHQGNYVFMMDLHVEGMVHYFEGHITSVHLKLEDLIVKEIEKMKALGQITDFLVGSTDTGRAKQVQHLAQKLGTDCAFVVKKREGERVIAQAIGVDCQDRDVVLYDDMIRSGSTLEEAFKLYKSCGAKQVISVTSHGIFTNPKKLDQLDHVIVTNTHPNCSRVSKAKIVDISSVIVNALKVRGLL